MDSLKFNEQENQVTRERRPRDRRPDMDWIIVVTLVWLSLFVWIFLLGHKKDSSPNEPSLYTPIAFLSRW
ncbi:MAG: hypothetical protein HY537_14325 [Deltaproteobacteria bacterium]|nr:hypothetical protein [Deltaproteobacteria bacterium]